MEKIETQVLQDYTLCISKKDECEDVVELQLLVNGDDIDFTLFFGNDLIQFAWRDKPMMWVIDQLSFKIHKNVFSLFSTSSKPDIEGDILLDFKTGVSRMYNGDMKEFSFDTVKIPIDERLNYQLVKHYIEKVVIN